MRLTGKTALVTGGSRGIGRAIVQRLARDGAAVVFTYKENKAAADDLVSQLAGTIAVRADQEDLTSISAMFQPVRDGLDILVNNAAVNPRMLIADITEDEFDRVLTVNTKFPVLAMREAAPVLRDNGRIISISTLNTVLPAPGHSLYCASKAALEQFTAVAARELGGRGITVNTISPGATETDLLHAVNSPEALAQTATLTALQRLGQPDDIAAVVAFLAGPDAQWITGQNIRATGGLLL
ncbi:SDR family oxidoreductase [Dactylosporangium sp. AC04546]|uniref:SDR family oxidoreductase n=1 Tax=Dactylosporangium sp. AC04546 TaxID=2862460 RepID=UPI001EDF60B5|nr:SDR family oxidoreductase [Dactylosporangium sp. AC04546]WVK86899.1 SDR family oxidoreductase [Dactylosporangium sp. AC04546]